MGRFVGLLGLLTMLGLAYAFSTDRKAIRLKTVLWGVGLQFALGVLVLNVAAGRAAFKFAGDAITKLLSYSYAGSSFVFGQLGLAPGAAPFAVDANGVKQSLFVFAFGVLPTIIFISALFALLYHYGVMQFFIKQLARFMTWLMGVSGAESMDVAASIFMGQTEAPLSIRPFLPELTRSELMTVMTAGMAHVSGGIMGAYIAFGVEAKHLLTAVIMTAPGTILMAKMLVPETGHPVTAKRNKKEGEPAKGGEPEIDATEVELHRDSNFLAAIARGTTDGLNLAINVGAMLISFLALIALTNGVLGAIHNGLTHIGYTSFPSDLQTILGVLFSPVAWLIGIPWRDAPIIGGLLGTRMVLNELVAFSFLGPMKATLDPRTFTIATFALCGFANLSSIGIQIGGIGALAPNKKDELARLGFRAMIAGTMANLMSAAIVGILYRG